MNDDPSKGKEGEEGAPGKKGGGKGGKGGGGGDAPKPTWWQRYVGSIAFALLVLLAAVGFVRVEGIADDAQIEAEKSQDAAEQVEANQVKTREALVVACEHRRDLARALRERDPGNPGGRNLTREIIETDCEAEYPEVTP